MSKLFFYDLETTGTNPGRNGIHQISGEIVIDGKSLETFDFKAQPNPKAQIEDAALAVGGVTREQIMAYPPMGQVYTKLVTMLAKYVNKYDKTDKFHLVGYNNRGFDDNFFRGFFLQNGDNYFGSWFWADSIDVLVLASTLLADRRAELPNFKLATVADFLGIDTTAGKLHDASFDIYVTKAVFDFIMSKFIRRGA
jgi:DNA polymerase-3 subunit epsilon